MPTLQQRRLLLSNGPFTGPYDAMPSIAAAYGMRRLRSAYTGPLLRLRRASDNAEQDFGYLANGDLDAAAIATFIAATTGLVATWYDQSGNGNNAVQATAANQPLYVSQAAGMAFDGTNDYLATTIVPVNDQTWSMVVRFANASGSPRSLAGRQISNQDFKISPRTTSSANRQYGSGGVLALAGAQTAGVMAIAGNLAFLNGVQETGTIPAGSGTATDVIFIGAINIGSAANLLAGNIQEMVISSATYTALKVAAITTLMG